MGSLERFLAQLAEQEAGDRARKIGHSAKDARQKAVELKQQQDAQERARLRELRKQPCGARTRAGHPCRRKGLGRGGRCPNHGGMSTGPKTEVGRQRIAAAQRDRWSAWRKLADSQPRS